MVSLGTGAAPEPLLAPPGAGIPHLDAIGRILVPAVLALRLFAQADVVICAHGQQLTNTALAMEPGSLLLEVSPRTYYPNDGPSMFALQNRNGDFQHTVLHSNGGRVDMPFNTQEAYEIIKKHSEQISQKPV